MSYLTAVMNLVGVGLFATLLWNTRARMAGLGAFSLALLPLAVRPFQPAISGLGSEWDVILRGLNSLSLASDVLILGAIYALRDQASATSADFERRLARVAAMLVMAALAFGAILRSRMYSASLGASTFADVSIALLSLYGIVSRWGTKPAGLVGALGFLLAIGGAGVNAANYFLHGQAGFAIPPLVTFGLYGLSQFAVLASFACAAQEEGVERFPYPGVATNGPNGARTLGLILVFVGCALYVLLAVGISEYKILEGLRGKAALLGALLPAAGLYLALVGCVRVTTGYPVWSLKR